MFARLTILMMTLALAFPHAARAQEALQGFAKLDSTRDWPWWRGALRNGLAGDRELVTKFGDSENVIWKSPVPGRGHSSPIVVGNLVFLASADEAKQTQSVLCYDLGTGQMRWNREISAGGFPKNNHPKNTEASTTIACDGERLFVTFFHHQQVELATLDLDGKPGWIIKAGPFDPKMFEYGYAPSPVLFDNLVIVAAEFDGPSSIAAFDRATGREVWRTPRTNSISFSSPVIANVAGKSQLMMSGANEVSSYDPNNGKLLWKVEGTTAATCGTMVWTDTLAIASGGYPKAETIAVVADGSGKVAWRNKQKCYEQSMIIVDGFVYAYTDNGVMYCWEASTGKEQWRERLVAKVSSSPICANGNIYWANESGTVYVFKANPERFELIAENRLGDESFASPAVSGDRLILRVASGRDSQRQEYLYCLGER